MICPMPDLRGKIEKGHQVLRNRLALSHVAGEAEEGELLVGVEEDVAGEEDSCISSGLSGLYIDMLYED